MHANMTWRMLRIEGDFPMYAAVRSGRARPRAVHTQPPMTRAAEVAISVASGVARLSPARRCVGT
jgi:hypothetical protein